MAKIALPLTASNPALLIDGTDKVLRRMTLSFAVLSWQLADIRAGFGKLVDVSPFQYVALQAIARVEMEEPWTARSLAKHFRVTNAYVSMELRGLIDREYIQTQPSEQDRRTKFLSLTPKGVRALTAMAPAQQKVNDLLYSQFDAKSLTKQCAIIERMTQDAEEASNYLKHLKANRKIGI